MVWSTYTSRIKRGWSHERAIGAPVPKSTSPSGKAGYRKLVPTLALTIHLAEGGSGPVGKRVTIKALAWAEYLETHALRAYGAVTVAESTAAREIVRRVRRTDLPREFSARSVYRSGWAKLTDRKTVQDALDLLADLDWVSSREIRHHTGGRPSTIYEFNPRGLDS